MFTGSTATGKKVMERAARTLTPVALELGGKDPMIVCADADLERAANAAVQYSMQNAGQTCISTERVYVEKPIYDDFVRLVTEKVNALRQGRPAGPGSTDLGAVIHPPQSDIVERHVADAVDKGARVLTGGNRRDDNGHYFEPTVLVDVDHTMDCMREETFGPTVPIMKVEDADEAVRLSNDTPYGLQASVWTKDARKGERLARRIEAGAVTVNDAQVNYLALELPMGGWKDGTGDPPRRRGHPQVHEEADPAGHELAAQARRAHDALQLAPPSCWTDCSSWSTAAVARGTPLGVQVPVLADHEDRGHRAAGGADDVVDRRPVGVHDHGLVLLVELEDVRRGVHAVARTDAQGAVHHDRDSVLRRAPPSQPRRRSTRTISAASSTSGTSAGIGGARCHARAVAGGPGAGIANSSAARMSWGS